MYSRQCTSTKYLFQNTKLCAAEFQHPYDYMLCTALAMTTTNHFESELESISSNRQLGPPEPDGNQDRADELRPIAYYRSSYLLQAFVYNQLGSVRLLLQAIAGTLPPPYHMRSHVGRKSEEDRSLYYNTDCG